MAKKKSWKFVYIIADQCRSLSIWRIFFQKKNVKIRKILISRAFEIFIESQNLLGHPSYVTHFPCKNEINQTI